MTSIETFVFIILLQKVLCSPYGQPDLSIEKNYFEHRHEKTVADGTLAARSDKQTNLKQGLDNTFRDEANLEDLEYLLEKTIKDRTILEDLQTKSTNQKHKLETIVINETILEDLPFNQINKENQLNNIVNNGSAFEDHRKHELEVPINVVNSKPDLLSNKTFLEYEFKSNAHDRVILASLPTNQTDRKYGFESNSNDEATFKDLPLSQIFLQDVLEAIVHFKNFLKGMVFNQTPLNRGLERTISDNAFSTDLPTRDTFFEHETIVNDRVISTKQTDLEFERAVKNEAISTDVPKNLTYLKQAPKAFVIDEDVLEDLSNQTFLEPDLKVTLRDEVSLANLPNQKTNPGRKSRRLPKMDPIWFT